MHCEYQFCHCPDMPNGFGHHYSCQEAHRKMNATERVHWVMMEDSEMTRLVKSHRFLRLSYVSGRKHII